MQPRGSMPHSQGFSNNPCPESNQPNQTISYELSLTLILLSFIFLVGR